MTMVSDLAREALEPFLPHADVFGWRPDDFVVYGSGGMNITAGDLRRSRTAYDAIGSGVKAEPEAFAYEILLHDDSWSRRLSYSYPHAPSGGEIRNVRALTHTAAGAGPVGEAVAEAEAERFHEAWSDFEDENDLFRDGHRHIRYRECREAFEAAWPDATKATANAAATLATTPVEEPASPVGEVERLTRERDEAREELSAFKACHGIGRVEDGYREVIWREATEFFQDECNIVSRSDHEAALAETRERLEKETRRIDQMFESFLEKYHASDAPVSTDDLADYLADVRRAVAALTGDKQEAGR